MLSISYCFADAASYRYATLCFFGGMLVIAILDLFVHLLAHHSDSITQFFLNPAKGMTRLLSKRKLERSQRNHTIEHPPCAQPDVEPENTTTKNDTDFTVKEDDSKSGHSSDLEAGCCSESNGCECPLVSVSVHLSCVESMELVHAEHFVRLINCLSSNVVVLQSYFAVLVPWHGWLLTSNCIAIVAPHNGFLQDTTESKNEQVDEAIGIPTGAAEVMEVLNRDPHSFALQKMGKWALKGND